MAMVIIQTILNSPPQAPILKGLILLGIFEHQVSAG
jgi:hypothetical protein